MNLCGVNLSGLNKTFRTHAHLLLTRADLVRTDGLIIFVFLSPKQSKVAFAIFGYLKFGIRKSHMAVPPCYFFRDFCTPK